MILKLEDIMDFSFLSLAFILSMFIGEIHTFFNYITFEVISNILSVGIQIMVLWGLIYKVKKFKKK